MSDGYSGILTSQVLPAVRKEYIVKMKINGSERILAEGITRSNDTWKTGLNNNDLIIGPSGSGKTRGYVIPNLLQLEDSAVVADTKGNLARSYGPYLKEKGFRVLEIDFKNMRSDCGYNPLSYIHREESGWYSEKDIKKITEILIPSMTKDDPFWDFAAREYMECLISFTMDWLPEEEHNLMTVNELYTMMRNGEFADMMDELSLSHPDCPSARMYDRIRGNIKAEKTHVCILAFIANALSQLTFEQARGLYLNSDGMNFAELGQQRTVLFLDISDTDRSMDPLVSLLYTQALQSLSDYADNECPDNRLPVPVRFILDDFATNCRIPDFDNIISVIRSREISVSIILQSISQLDSIYGEARAQTILNNCDTWLYLGGHDQATIQTISRMFDLPCRAIQNMPLTDAYLFSGGGILRKVRKYDLDADRHYQKLSYKKGEHQRAVEAVCQLPENDQNSTYIPDRGDIISLK